MRILFIYKYLTLGGVETVLKARLEGFKSLGVEAKAWFFRDGPGRVLFEDMLDDFLIGDLTDLRRYLEAWRPEVVDSMDSPEVLTILDSLSYRPRLIFESHTPYPENRLYLKRLEPTRIERVLVPSQHHKKLVRKSLKSSIPLSVVPNSVRGVFLEDNRHIKNSPPDPIVGWVGRLDNLKNWELLAEIGHDLARIRNDFEIWLVGRAGNHHSERRAISVFNKREILSKLKWFQALPHDRMPSWFDAIRQSGGIVLSTSKVESFGMVIAEAMARSCTVIVPSQPPFSEFIKHGISGFTYPINQPGKVVREINRLLEDNDLRFKVGQKAKKAIRSKHSSSVSCEALLKLFEP